MTQQEFAQTVALVGVGYWGKNLARNFNALGALHTICDSNESSLDRYEEMYPNVHFTSNFSSVMENPQITAVAIATPAFTHYKLAKQALETGKDVYVEKPLCLDCDEAEELIHLAEKHQRILMVGHLLQYHPCVNKLQEMLATGELGKLQYIVSNRLNLGKVRTEENALWNFAPHDVSVILSLCGHRLPEQVRCVGAAYISKGVADTSMTTLRFGEDVRAHIYVSWLNPFKEQKLIVVGSAGMAVFDDTRPWEEKLVVYRDHLRWEQGQIPQTFQREPEKVHVEQSEPLRDECAHFLTCCIERKKPRTDGSEGLRVLQVLQAAQASLDQDGASKDPFEKHFTVLGKLAQHFAHPTAVVDSGAEIGKDSKIWHFSHIMKGAKLGEKCNIGQNVVISPGVRLGDNCKVQNNVSVYTGVECEDDVFLGPSAVFTNINNPRCEVVRRGQYVKTLLRKGASVGANATIVCGVELGQYSFVGAGAVVTKDVKPFALMVGNPAKQMGWMSRYGEKLDLPVAVAEGETQTAECPATGESYMLEGTTLRLAKPAESLTSKEAELATTS